MRNSKQYDILISCPTNMEKKGIVKIIKSVVDNYNSNCGYKNGISIRTLYWKDNLYPEYGDIPQNIINRQIVQQADIIFAIFGSIFGTPTTNYNSGTEEEIEIMINSGKPIFLYFQTEKIEINDFNLNEAKKVLHFKQKYSKRGFYKEFKTKEEFKQVLYNDLIKYFDNSKIP